MMIDEFQRAASRQSPVQEGRAPIQHEMKCWPEFFAAIEAGEKRHDLRRADDRDFKIGDTLLLREFDPASDRYTGRTQVVRVTYITSAELPCALSRDALNPNFCILSIKPAK